MWVHVLRNASIPIITHVMAALPGLLVGAFLIERFFSIPGIGREVIYEGLRRLRAKGMRAARVGTAGFNAPAQALYEACGFVRAGTCRTFMKVLDRPRGAA